LTPLVPDGFAVPAGLETERFRLRMLTVRDVLADFEAIRERVDPDGTPRGEPGLTLEQNLIDLGWHQKEFQRRTSFAYTVVAPGDDGHVLGCAYIDPSDEPGFDARAHCWVRREAAALDRELHDAFRAWIEREWPFERVAYPGRDA
jgi:hypothetical protein